jgi:hypothetical protein
VAPWNFGTAPISFLFGPAALDLNLGAARVASAGWTSLRVEIQGGQMQFTFAGLHLGSDLLPGLPLEGDATLVFKDGKFRSDIYYHHLLQFICEKFNFLIKSLLDVLQK